MELNDLPQEALIFSIHSATADQSNQSLLEIFFLFLCFSVAVTKLI